VLTLPPSVKIYLASTPTDMRKGFDGLMAIVRNQWEYDVFSGHLFVFVSRRRNRAKILFWDRGGFVLYYKRLERGRFRLPKFDPDAVSVELDADQLTMLLNGIDYSRVRRPLPWMPPMEKKRRKIDRSTRS
jgi:transposase